MVGNLQEPQTAAGSLRLQPWKLSNRKHFQSQSVGLILVVTQKTRKQLLLPFFCRLTGAGRSSPRGCDQQEAVQRDCNGRNVQPISFQYQMDESSGFRDIFRSTGQNSKYTRETYFYPKIFSLWLIFLVSLVFVGYLWSVYEQQGEEGTDGGSTLFILMTGMVSCFFVCVFHRDGKKHGVLREGSAFHTCCGGKRDGWLQLLQRQKETDGGDVSTCNLDFYDCSEHRSCCWMAEISRLTLQS